jgi:hypothetical protein
VSNRPRAPIILEDFSGRQLETEAFVDVNFFVVVLTMLPIGAMLYKRSGETTALGRPIFRQVGQRVDAVDAVASVPVGPRLN